MNSLNVLSVNLIVGLIFSSTTTAEPPCKKFREDGLCQQGYNFIDGNNGIDGGNGGDDGNDGNGDISDSDDSISSGGDGFCNVENRGRLPEHLCISYCVEEQNAISGWCEDDSCFCAGDAFADPFPQQEYNNIARQIGDVNENYLGANDLNQQATTLSSLRRQSLDISSGICSDYLRNRNTNRRHSI
ncbi:hypothetical protein QAD02_009904 [Eretmocerus hayati]|uniref:Uncharacterized protein n=1 Tax=Eretmocerus hayati TaxID=131215 RepID=A0ACC2NB09_9HYME|nr:hypothetical protein QAD02_009904 [Eretmocerus hayati]